MLLEIEIQNERAFAEASSLSLIASKLKEANDDAVRDVGNLAKTRALTSALILGKNGSGKSSLIDAFSFVSRFVRSSAKDSQADEELEYEPNELIDKRKNEPTRYRVLFSVQKYIYEYKFSFDKTRIVSESLDIADKSTRFRRAFSREWEKKSKSYIYEFGEAIYGPKHIWQKSTRENALFLSTAIQLNSESLKDPYDWLANYLRTTRIDASGDTYTTKRCFEDKKFRKKVVSFLQAMDINIEDLQFEEEDIDTNFLNKAFSKEFLKEMRSSGASPFLDKRKIVKFVKRKSDGSTTMLPIKEESTGTRALYNLAGPLHDTLENGYCLLIDEINTSLHPVVVHFLIKMFNSKRTNPKRAQLICTSHDVSILRDEFVRRDQVWFIENDGCGAQLVPLSDYAPRRTEALERGYLRGRYGGIPTIDSYLLKFVDTE